MIAVMPSPPSARLASLGARPAETEDAKPMGNLTRREFLAGAGAAVAATLGERPAGATGAAGQPSFQGARAGEARSVAGVEFRWCPAGRFRMGSPPDEPDRRGDEARVDVTITRGFWVAAYAVTQGLWARVVGPLPGALSAGDGDGFPVYNVNHPEAEAFCAELTRRWWGAGDLPGAWELRLPTEAQWEYACRAGTRTATAFGDRLSSRQANFRGDAPYNGAEQGPTLGRTQRVGSYAPNAWGVHDMHGNVFEWCRDWYHPRLPGGADPDLWAAPPLGGTQPRRERVTRAPRRLLGRCRLALPVGLPRSVRAGAPRRPHRVSGRRRPTVAPPRPDVTSWRVPLLPSAVRHGRSRRESDARSPGCWSGAGACGSAGVARYPATPARARRMISSPRRARRRPVSSPLASSWSGPAPRAARGRASPRRRSPRSA
jgi:formylglycine-generating enzyme